MRTVTTLADLYTIFESDPTLASLNHRIYKDTECGASISVYGTLPASEVDPQARTKAEAAGLHSLLMTEYDRILPTLTEAYQRAPSEEQERILPTLTEAYQRAPSEEQERIAAADGDFHQGNTDALVTWARTVMPEAFLVTNMIVDRVPVAYHNGHKGEIPESFVLTGFTIQSIVEGSDAEVCSDTFPIGTTEDEIDAWIADMEDETDRLWHEAND